MHGRKTLPLTIQCYSKIKLISYWLKRAHLSLVSKNSGTITLKLLKKCSFLYDFLAALYQKRPNTNLLTVNNLRALDGLLDYDAGSTLAALRALDNAGKLTQRAFNKIVISPETALITAYELGGIPYEKDKALIENFVELRKNTHLIAQANRTETSFFCKLPPEIQLKIIKRTCDRAMLPPETIYATIANTLS